MVLTLTCEVFLLLTHNRLGTRTLRHHGRRELTQGPEDEKRVEEGPLRVCRLRRFTLFEVSRLVTPGVLPVVLVGKEEEREE